MEIRKLNPIGYTTQTSDGREYKKSNKGKSIFLAGSVLTNGYMLLKDHKEAKASANSFERIIPKNNPAPRQKFLTICGIVVKLATVAVCAIDMGLSYIIGDWFDKKIDEGRIKKLAQADKQ